MAYDSEVFMENEVTLELLGQTIANIINKEIEIEESNSPNKEKELKFLEILGDIVAQDREFLLHNELPLKVIKNIEKRRLLINVEVKNIYNHE